MLSDILLCAGITLLAFTILSRSLLKSTIGLAVISAVLTVIIFRLASPLAAVFELSICAGLIPVVFINAISLVKPLSYSELKKKSRGEFVKYTGLPVLLGLAALAIFLLPLPQAAVSPGTGAGDAREVIWNEKALNILGQIIIMLVGVFGVVILFKERKKDDRTE